MAYMSVCVSGVLMSPPRQSLSSSGVACWGQCPRICLMLLPRRLPCHFRPTGASLLCQGSDLCWRCLAKAPPGLCKHGQGAEGRRVLGAWEYPTKSTRPEPDFETNTCCFYNEVSPDETTSFGPSQEPIVNPLGDLPVRLLPHKCCAELVDSLRYE